MTMTISGDGTIGGLVAGGLPNATIVQADLADNVAGNGPAFSAYITSAQTITSGVTTLAQFGTEVFDTNSRFNNTGSAVGGIPAYAFMPNIAGYYQINWSLYVVIDGGTGANLRSYLQKNGSFFINGSFPYNVTLSDLITTGSAVVYFDGVTDYVQVYGAALFLNSGTPKLSSGQTNSTFSGALVRAA